MTFLNPLVLLGLAAAAVPILVHLFHFRRPTQVDFSTLIFLREVEEQAMQRVRIRQWLLLALRVLTVICLVLAFAQPAFESAWGSVLGEQAPRSAVVVMDNSQSMALRDAQGAYFDQARQVGQAIVEQSGTGDEQALVLTAPAVEAAPTLTTARAPLLDALEAAEPVPGASLLTDALGRAVGLLDDAALPRREVILLSDLQRATFSDSTGTPLADDVRLSLIPVGGDPPVNTAVTDVRVVSRLIQPGRPVEVEATVTRYGGDPGMVGVRLSLGGRVVGEAAAEVTPGEPTRVRFTVTPPQRGWLPGEVRIEPDAAEWDDVRHVALNVPPPARVLLVGGGAARTDLVRLALEVAAETGTLSLTETTPSGLASADLDETGVVIWVSPESVTGTTAERLSRFVREGGGLMLFAGMETEATNTLLAAIGGGEVTGIAEVSPGSAAQPLGETTGAALDHPLFEGILDEGGARRLETVTLNRLARYAPGGGDEQMLIETSLGSPLLQEIRQGEGAALLVTVSPNSAWSDLPTRGLFVPLLARGGALLAAAEGTGDRATLTVREAASVRVEGVTGREPLRLVAPMGDTVTPPQRSVPGGVVLDLGGALIETGVYAVRQGERTLRLLAVNEAARESDPEALSPEDAAERLETLTGRPVQLIDGTGGAGIAAVEENARVQPWLVLLAIALASLLAEMLLSVRWRENAAA